MKIFMYVVIAVVVLAAHLSSPIGYQILPVYAKYLPDVLSMVVAAYVVAVGARQRFRYLNAKYLVVFGTLMVVMVCGVFVNGDQPGPVLSGARYYLRAIPFFFLPAVVDFSDRQAVRYLGALTVLSLLQVPIAIYQRYAILSRGGFSGDDVRGTLMHSGALSIFLIAVLCMLTTLMIRGRLNKLVYGVLLVLFMIPMSINETKATIFLLPLGILTAIITAAPRHKRLRVGMYGLVLLAVAGGIFIPLYDYFATVHVHGDSEFTIGQMFTDKDFFSHYLDDNTVVGTEKSEAGRVDALSAPLTSFSSDPIRLAFGLGVGNASTSPLGPQFTGRYARTYGIFATETSAATFLVETGVFGLALILLLHYLVLQDAMFVVRRDNGLMGALACGWVGAWLVITLGNFYIAAHFLDAGSYIPWFFSGLMAAKRERLSAAFAEESPPVVEQQAPAARALGSQRARQQAQ